MLSCTFSCFTSAVSANTVINLLKTLGTTPQQVTRLHRIHLPLAHPTRCPWARHKASAIAEPTHRDYEIGGLINERMDGDVWLFEHTFRIRQLVFLARLGVLQRGLVESFDSAHKLVVRSFTLHILMRDVPKSQQKTKHARLKL